MLAAIERVWGMTKATPARLAATENQSSPYRPLPIGVTSRFRGSSINRSAMVLIIPLFTPKSSNKGASTAANPSTAHADSNLSWK